MESPVDSEIYVHIRYTPHPPPLSLLLLCFGAGVNFFKKNSLPKQIVPF